jgi:hypothetical protein
MCLLGLIYYFWITLMQKHVIDFIWKEKEPYFVLRDVHSTEIVYIPLVGFTFNWHLMGKRLCPGTFPVHGKDYEECPNKKDLTETNYHRCKACEDTIGFKANFLFNYGKDITDRNAREFLQQKHYVYLAYFPHDIIKVGTASEGRKIDRLYEQGAFCAYFIASQRGFEIQRIERYISTTCDVVESVPMKQKFKHLFDKINADMIKKQLMEKFNHIKKKLKESEFSGWLLKKPEFISLDYKILQGFNNQHLANIEWLSNINFLGGKIITVKGRFIILENNGNFYTIDGKSLIGELVEESKEKVVLRSTTLQQKLF